MSPWLRCVYDHDGPMFPRGRALAGAMIGIAAWVVGHASAQSPDRTIPDELAVIAAACRENSARIRTLQLSGTLILTGGRYEGQWDPIADQTHNSQTREFSVWKDALNCRFDVTADREMDGATGEVHYNLAYGEHITSYARLDLAALKRQYGTPQSTRQTIVTPNKVYRYRPEANQLELNDFFTARALDEQPETEMQLVLNKAFAGFTVAEFVDRWAELASRGDRSIETTSLGDGKYRIRTAVEGKPTLACASEAIIDLDKGANVLSYVGQIDGQIVRTGQFDYMQAGGAWVVLHAEVAELVGADSAPMVKVVYDVHPESVRINEPIDPQVFTFEALAVRRGALVFDSDTGEEYLYDDVPLHVKVALAMEREREEELAEAEAQAAQSPPPIPVEEPAQELQPVEPAPPAVAAAGPAKRATSGPGKTVVVTPTSRATPPPDTVPAHAPVDTRVLTTRPVPKMEAAPPDNPAPPPPSPAARPLVPSAAMTAAVVSVGCAAALGIGIWKLIRRGTTPRGGS